MKFENQNKRISDSISAIRKPIGDGSVEQSLIVSPWLGLNSKITEDIIKCVANVNHHAK